MIQIYSENNTNYENNGDVVLDPIACDLKATLNGAWEVTLEAPLDEQDKFQAILTNAVLCADTPQGKKQLFRLYDVQRSETDVMAYARPIFLDSARDVFFVDCRPTELDGQAALDYLMKDTPYSGTSDIKLEKTAYYIRKNLIEALAGSEDNSFLNRWGGEIIYDNYNISIMVQQGSDNDVRVEFGTNIESIKETIDVDEMGTRLVPVAFNGRTLDGDEPWVDSPLIDNYPIVYYKIVNFDDMRLIEDFTVDEDGNIDEDIEDYEVFDTLAELQAAMVERCEQMFIEGVDVPAITYDINMVDLRQADEYKEYQDLEEINLGDTVYCYHRRLGIETKARIIEYTYDCVRQCITNLVIGDYQENYLDHLNDITSSSGGQVDFSQIWSQFDYIEANYVRTSQLEAEVGKFGYLTADEADITYARITDLDAALITVNELLAGYAKIDQLEALVADIGILNADVANIVTILSGGIGTGTLDVIHLTADNAVIESAVILEALVEEAIIGDLLAGVIYTDYITIMDNENGNMVLTGPTIQFMDSDGNYRMQVGLDGDGNFNIYIMDASGNVIFDALGLTEAGLIGNGAIIRDVAVADDANISGYKLNIQEVASCLTADGTLIVDAGQVIINGETLSAVYTEIQQDVNTALSDAEKALEAAGELIEIGARNYLLNTRALSYEADKTIYDSFSLSQDESEFGVLTETGNGSLLMLTAISAQKNSLSGKKMVFACDLLENNLTSILDDYDLEFGIWVSNDDGETWSEYAEIGSTLNEDSVFEFNRDDLTDNEWSRLIAKFTADGVDHVHTVSGAYEFEWAVDYLSCNFIFTCGGCGMQISEPCVVSETKLEPTCVDSGLYTYQASIEVGGSKYLNKEQSIVPALGHDYEGPTFEWVGEISSGNRYSEGDSIVESGQLGDNVYYDIYDNGFCRVYGSGGTDNFSSMNPAARSPLYQDSTIKALVVEGDITELNGAVFYGMSALETADMSESKVETVGGNCFQNCISLETVVLSESTTKIYGYAFNGCTELRSVTFIGDAPEIGSAYEDTFLNVTATCYYPADNSTWDDFNFDGYGGNLTWVQQSDVIVYTACTATFKCSRCGDTQTVDCEISETATIPPCTTDGEIVYTATVTFDGKTYSDSKTVEVPAQGHTYEAPIFEWADDYSTCVATFICKYGDDVQTVNCTVTEDDESCTATCEFNGQTYTDTADKVRKGFAIYCENDGTLTFYGGYSAPDAGSTYDGKAVTAVYVDFESVMHTPINLPPWYENRLQIKTVIFDESFSSVELTNTAFWFYGFTATTAIIDADNINMSKIKSIQYMFANCTALENIEGIETWDTSSVQLMNYMFYWSRALVELNLSGWNTVSVSNTISMFQTCQSLKTIYVQTGQFDLSNVGTGNDLDMFIGCSALVGGNGTTYDSSKVGASMAHIDTADNPGYFTNIADKP